MGGRMSFGPKLCVVLSLTLACAQALDLDRFQDGEGGSSPTGAGASSSTGTLLPLGAACSSARACASAACVDGLCCDALCDQACESCLAALTGMPNGFCEPVLPGTELCNGYQCNGTSGCPSSCAAHADCDSTYYCDASARACVPRKVNGAPCQSDPECIQVCSDKDAICCDAECPGPCVSCLGTYTGERDGVCLQAIDSTDPYRACSPSTCMSGSCT